jgi:hypothetical protein
MPVLKLHVITLLVPWLLIAIVVTKIYYKSTVLVSKKLSFRLQIWVLLLKYIVQGLAPTTTSCNAE